MFVLLTVMRFRNAPHRLGRRRGGVVIVVVLVVDVGPGLGVQRRRGPKHWGLSLRGLGLRFRRRALALLLLIGLLLLLQSIQRCKHVRVVQHQRPFIPPASTSHHYFFSFFFLRSNTTLSSTTLPRDSPDNNTCNFFSPDFEF